MIFDPENWVMTKSLRMMMTRAKQLVKLLERMLKQDHLFSEEQIVEIKQQLRIVKKDLAVVEAQTTKGFGKK